MRNLRNLISPLKRLITTLIAKRFVTNIFLGLSLTLLLAALASCSSLPISYEAQLADHLTQTGAKMYGAYWCPYCALQKEYFGGAVSRIPYIECDPEGFNTQADLCQTEGIQAYPTWVIEGDRHLGAQPLGRLAHLSGFDSGITPTESGDESVDEKAPAGGYSPAR